MLEGLNDAQRAAAEAVRGPVCILAGAGSGKTRTITHRIAHQIATGTAAADQVLAVTFTERAAAQLKSRLAALGIAQPIRAATFHAAAWAQLRYFWPQTSDEPLPDVLPSKLPVLVPIAQRLRVEARASRNQVEARASLNQVEARASRNQIEGRDLAAEIEWAKARRLSPDDYARGAKDRNPPLAPQQMAAVYAEYERVKRSRNAIDYEDMLLEMTRLLDERPDVAGQVRDRYRFFTVDEFQDVNPAQWALLRAWLGERDELCVVGDDDQCIYSFTGATARYLIDFRRTYPGATVVELRENYRSTPQVIALANRVLRSKPAHLRRPLEARGGGGPAPRFVAFDDAEAEVQAVVQEVRQLLDDGVAAGEIAICYRVNSQSEAFEEAFRAARVPAVVRGDRSFFERSEVRQALRVLVAAANRREVRGDPPPVPGEPVGVRADRQLEDVLREGLRWHPDREPDGATARDRWRNLRALADIATGVVDADPSVTFEALVANLQARARAGGDDSAGNNAVNLMTLHKAKGLEFDAVFLVALEEGYVPISYAETDDEIDEEQRLLYVGVTRARRHLWCSCATTRFSSRKRQPSRFLRGLLGDERPKSKPKPQLDSGDPVVESLRAWRSDRASADGVPAYVVFDNKTLGELVERRPATLAALRQVPGFGAKRLERYGGDILAVLQGAGAH